MLSLEDFLYDITSSHGDNIRPSGPVKRINHGCLSGGANVNQSKFSADTTESSRQKQSLAERRLRNRMVIDRN
jgi:hypothetical protein